MPRRTGSHPCSHSPPHTMAKEKFNLTAFRIASLLGGTVQGDPQAVAVRFSRIEEGREGDLCFFANPKYESFVYSCRCTVLLVRDDFTPSSPLTPTLVRVKDPYSGMATLLAAVSSQGRRKSSRKSLRARWFLSTRFGRGVSVGAFSYVGRRVSVGEGTAIHENVYVGDGTTIGKNCILYPGVRIYPGMQIGNNVIIHSNAVIGSDGFGNAPQEDGSWKKIEHLGNVVIGDDCEIGACTTIDRAEFGSTVLGRGVKLDNLCQIAHNVQVGDNTVMAAMVGIAGSTKIGRNCVFAGQSGAAGHVVIADNTTVAGGAGIIGDIKVPGQTLMGLPAIPRHNYLRSYALFRKSGKPGQ